MANPFQSVQMRKPQANTFKLNHDVKYSMQMGTLIPTLVQEVLPGDVFKIKAETLIRFAPLIAPVMHNITCFTHYFFVPNRIVWPNWEDFISPDLAKTAPPAWPYLRITRAEARGGKSTLWDYFGLPPTKTGETGVMPDVSAIPFAAYQAIYNEYYRDQNLIPEVNYQLNNGIVLGPQISPLMSLRKRAWMHDYFTSALPFAQKGPSVDIPIGSASDVEVYHKITGNTGITEWTGSSQSITVPRQSETPDAPGGGVNTRLYAATSDITGLGTINDLRTAMRLQEWFEKAARGGSRYVEQLMVHWNVKSSDARLNRPEFLGGTRNPVIISEVLQTSSSDTTTPQANMAGHAISANSGRSIRYRAEEHGYIIGIQSIMPNTAYQQGIPRHFSRTSWEDYAWPTFAHLGEQEILNKELYVADDLDNEKVFGYIPRYSEYRYTPSRVAGEFRDTLQFWHLGRFFTARPNLNQAFIEANPDTRIFAVKRTDNQYLWCHTFNKVSVYRKLPKYGTPAL